MDLIERSSRNIQEAINYETLVCATRRAESYVEPLFEEVGTVIPMMNPMTVHPNTYADAFGLDPRELLEVHSRVKAQFLRLEASDLVLKRGDDAYPDWVAEVRGSPRFLYTRGDISLLDRKCVCVVGTRSPSTEGKEYTKQTVQALISHNVVIVSGLALGIDGIAHISTLALGGQTVAVIGTPLTEVYPAEHRDLQRMIGERGLVITRFSPATQTQKWHFLVRNQLMSSLGSGSVVIEDRDGGGAVKQAHYALEQDRCVVLFQHVVDNRSLLWPRRFSLKSGVLVVKKAEHIHARLFSKARTPSRPTDEKRAPDQLSLFDFS